MTLSNTSDHDLVAAARAGDPEAFGELDRRHRPSVRQAVEHLVHDPDLADDLTQETFIKAYEALDGFRPDARFAPWILQIANRVALDHLKKEQRLRRKGQDTVPLEPTPDTSSPRMRATARPHVSLPSDSITRPDPRDVRRAMEEAIAMLRGQQRRCLYLREIEGHSYEHIAEMLGLTKGTVSSHITRGRKQLRAMPGPHQDLLPPR